MFVISSPSGGGKTTVVERLCAAHPQLSRSISVTTRPPRPGERAGYDYYFVSDARFQQLRRAKQLLEWAHVHGASYGTPKQPVTQALAHGRDVILSLDVQGAHAIRRIFGARSVLIFLVPPSMRQLRNRLLRRHTDTPAAIRQRLAVARRELACAAWYDETVVNDRVTRAVRRIAAILRRPPASVMQSARSRKGSSYGTSRH